VAIPELAAIRKQKREEDRLKRWEAKQIMKEDERKYGKVHGLPDITPKEAIQNMEKSRFKTAG
jgi:hypothetical protein